MNESHGHLPKIRVPNHKIVSKFSNHRRDRNTILKIVGVDGSRVRGFKDMIALCFQYFKNSI